MENCDFIMLIMNCKKYKKKATFQKKTWLPLISEYIKYYHVIGDDNIDTDYIFDEDNRVLTVKVADDYNSLPKKVIASYKAVFETFQFKYIFKTDDDQILVNPKFLDMVAGLTVKKVPKTHYGGFIVDIKQPYFSEYHRIHPELPQHIPLYVTKYCSGRFYFLSKSAVSNLLSKKENIESEYLEDYAIGFYLDPDYKKDVVHLATNIFFTDIELSDFEKWLKDGKI
jgi:hypothetical protein